MPGNRIGDLLRDHPDLRLAHQNLEQLASLKSALSEILPDGLAVPAAILGSGELTLYADNGPMAAKLKHLSKRIGEEMRKRGYEVTGIRVHVQARFADNPLPQKHISLSAPASDTILKLADRLRPSALKAALLKLGRRPSS